MDVGEVLTEKEEGRNPRMLEPMSKKELLCSSGSSCVPLEECTIIKQLMKNSCLQTVKLRGITCGYKGVEPLVCCPDICPSQNLGISHDIENHANCGQPKLNNWWSSNYKGVGAHPWVARVGFKNKLTDRVDYLCCGSIISRHIVLTAAHCALAKTATHKITNVRVGEYDSKQDLDCTSGFCAKKSQDLPINYIIVHPGYDTKTFRHNIALLILKENMEYSLAVQPICLYQRVSYSTFSGMRGILVGWGKLANQEDTQSKQQQVSMPIRSLDLCNLLYGSSVPITENQLCVGGEIGKDACSGFGGAPLVILDPNYKDKYFQIGIMSFGSVNCGSSGEPSVYSRVDKYADWIMANSPRIV
ncbi:CLIP domain-containing serine protease HP8-like isoform X2 [Rhodnius prolixus]|uniref:CLIP domain-containing serine protease HP8-like isoform X2 n=1 Tax=Rhodnius prolixus TaxID=13249 RepID=UPI003D18D107